MNQVPRRVRLRLIAAVSAILVLAGGGGASAYWTGQARVQTQASAASTGLQLQVVPSATAPTPLAVTYTSQNLSAAGAVTIRNTGSRSASSALTLLAQEPTAAGLPAAIRVAVAPVEAAVDCTPQRMLSSPTTGALSASTALTFTSTVAAGTTTTLCIQTSMQSSDATRFANQSLSVAIAAKLTYAAGSAWAVSASAPIVKQAVGASALALREEARYTILHQGICVQRDGSNNVVRGSGCDASLSEWRFINAGNGTFHILEALNARPVPEAKKRWTDSSSFTAVRSASLECTTRPDSSQDCTLPGTTRQQWRITADSAGTFRIESVSRPGDCAAIGAVSSTGVPVVALATCDSSSAAQAFAFQMVGDPLPPNQQLSCPAGGLGSGITLTLPKTALYDLELEYRAFIASAATPGSRTALGNLTATGSTPSFSLPSNNSNLRAFVDANGAGNARVYVEQRIAQTTWMPVADAQVRTAGSGSTLQIGCGWQ